MGDKTMKNYHAAAYAMMLYHLQKVGECAKREGLDSRDMVAHAAAYAHYFDVQYDYECAVCKYHLVGEKNEYGQTILPTDEWCKQTLLECIRKANK